MVEAMVGAMVEAMEGAMVEAMVAKAEAEDGQMHHGGLLEILGLHLLQLQLKSP